MNRWLTFLALTFFLGCRPSADSIIADASVLEERGDLVEAEKLLRTALEGGGDDVTIRRLRFEIDRLARIRMDYPYTRDEVWGQIERSVKDASREEFERWIGEGKFDIRQIDGREMFVNVSRSNLFWRNPEIASRRISSSDDAAFERSVLMNARAIRAAVSKEGRSYVLPKSFDVRMTLRVRPDAAPAGSVIKAWLPVPRTFPFQWGFTLLRSSGEASVDSADSPIRSVFLRQVSSGDSSTIFSIEYRYTHAGIAFLPEPGRAVVYDRHDPALNAFLREEEHVAFTDKMRQLSEEVGRGESNPVLLARSFYEWISENIQYSYALEYSTIRNLGDYCLSKRYGDCGQEAMLFITLCRMNGIPARWQSGWFTFPGGKTIHDWTEIYVEPWGWMPVDPYMGIFAMQYLTTLTDAEKKEVRDFYFCGLDQYRIAANSAHAQDLRPAKLSMRSDNVDFQRGEVEYDSTNIYFDKYAYRLDVVEDANSMVR